MAKMALRFLKVEILQNGVINNMADENIYDEFKEAIPVMSGDTMDIAIDEAFAPIGQSNSELNHAVLNNRDIPNQHPITAIEGLRDELNNIENLKTEYSDEMGFANYYPWEDGGDSKYSRIGYFVTVADRERRIKICTESDEVFGVTVVTTVGGIALIVAIVLPAIRNAVHFFYSSRQKLSDYFAIQAALVEMNANNLKYNVSRSEKEREQIYKAQMKWVDRFKSLSTKLSTKMKKADSVSKNKLEEDASKKYSYDDVTSGGSASSLF